MRKNTANLIKKQGNVIYVNFTLSEALLDHKRLESTDSKYTEEEDSMINHLNC